MTASIYVITNTVNQKKYVGFTTRGIEQRFLEHRRYANAGSGFYLHKAMRKHGLESFIIEEVYTSEDEEHTLREMEPHYIRLLRAYGSGGYNGNEGGALTNTPEKRARASARMKANNPNANNKAGTGWKKGRTFVMSEGHRQKISAAKVGDLNPNYGKTGLSKRLNVLVKCSRCGQEVNKGNWKRWHEENCRHG